MQRSISSSFHAGNRCTAGTDPSPCHADMHYILSNGALGCRVHNQRRRHNFASAFREDTRCIARNGAVAFHAHTHCTRCNDLSACHEGTHCRSHNDVLESHEGTSRSRRSTASSCHAGSPRTACRAPLLCRVGKRYIFRIDVAAFHGNIQYTADNSASDAYGHILHIAHNVSAPSRARTFHKWSILSSAPHECKIFCLSCLLRQSPFEVSLRRRGSVQSDSASHDVPRHAPNHPHPTLLPKPSRTTASDPRQARVHQSQRID
mmetsp:Transcript_57935/g.109108  ORF Transcript_57935/g.109108 Transcript_57935/m.109108 type:complete len:262 (+) Transcript_57935:563-1348(+)